MKKFALLIGTAAVAMCLGTASSWAVVTGQSVLFVDPETGLNRNTTCGQAGTGVSTGPCATLNQALANAANGASIFITRPGVFGPIIITGPINISGPPDGQAIIQWLASTVPGCVGGSSCNGGSNATYAVDIQAGATNTVKLKNVIINANGTNAAAVHVNTAFGVSLTKVPLRCGAGTSTPEAMLVDSSQNSQLQLYFHDSDIGFCGGGGAILVAPTGTTPVRMNFNNSEVHNAQFGLTLNATGLTGTASIDVLVDSSQFFSFNNGAIGAVASSNSNQSVVSLNSKRNRQYWSRCVEDQRHRRNRGAVRDRDHRQRHRHQCHEWRGHLQLSK